MYQEIYINSNGRSMDYFDYLEMKEEIKQEQMEQIIAATKKTTFLGRLWQWLNT